ncbi:MAG: hypothetical protein LHV68_09825 [Elusimicrobia bacterium]|nr:hypothetical protein [Candidatus Liberimonas magnetica]
MISLKGIFGISLGGFPCIRGYAKLGDLAKISKANPGFQRELLPHHKKDIEIFLDNQEYLFFSEIVLSCPLYYDYGKKNAISGLNPINSIGNKENFSSNVNKLSIKFKKNTDIVELTIDETKNDFLLSRVDGNHRLSASDLKDSFKEYTTPFCIILFSDDKSDKRDKVIFHNINFRSIPLEFEHSLKIFLDDVSLFSDDELKKPSLGWAYYFARKLMHDDYQNISVLHKDGKYRHILVNAVKLLLERGAIKENEDELSKIRNALNRLDTIYLKYPVIHSNSGIFSTMLYLQIQKEYLIEPFLQWVTNDLVYDIKEISPESLLEIFNKRIESRSREIFISMDFNNKHSKLNFNVVSDVIDSINQKYFNNTPPLQLKKIKVDNPNDPCTFRITEEIVCKIETCGLLIADLTGMNLNVYHESGYAMGYIKGKGLSNKIMFLLYHDKKDRDVDKKVAFNLRDFSQLRFSNRKLLKSKIKDRILRHYNLL